MMLDKVFVGWQIHYFQKMSGVQTLHFSVCLHKTFIEIASFSIFKDNLAKNCPVQNLCLPTSLWSLTQDIQKADKV